MELSTGFSQAVWEAALVSHLCVARIDGGTANPRMGSPTCGALDRELLRGRRYSRSLREQLLSWEHPVEILFHSKLESNKRRSLEMRVFQGALETIS